MNNVLSNRGAAAVSLHLPKALARCFLPCPLSSLPFIKMSNQQAPKRGPPSGRGPRPNSAVAAPSRPTNTPANGGGQRAPYSSRGPVVPQDDDVMSQGSDLEHAAAPLVDLKYLTDKKFADFAITAESKRALAEVLKYTFCSRVQADALPKCLGNDDVMAKARTGTGKTLAFVIPTIEKIIRNPAPRGKISALILSPTRELARQIMVETTKLLTFHNLSTQVMYGGVDVKKNLNALRARIPDIVIATPGRCLDLMTQTSEPRLTRLFDSVRVLVFDEADNLLDMGFRPQIQKILAQLPRPADRQTFLFSATFPTDVKQLVNTALRPQHCFVDSVGEEVDTHAHVDQSILIVSFAQLAYQLYQLIKRHVDEEPEYKIMIFLSTAQQTAFYAAVFSQLNWPVLEMHSRKSQAQRDKVSAEFRAAKNAIMFSSDVSARGVDYPNVSYVIQLGCPSSKEQFVHRSGRTGRAGKSGSCALLLADFERPFAARVNDLNMQQLQPVVAPPNDREAVMVERAVCNVDTAQRAKAYSAFLGYYKSHSVLKYNSADIVAIANDYAMTGMGLPSPPALSAQLVGKMGLKNVPGITIDRDAVRAPSGRGGGGGRGGGAAAGGGRGGSDFQQPPAQQQQQRGPGQLVSAVGWVPDSERPRSQQQQRGGQTGYEYADAAPGDRRPAQQQLQPQGGRPSSSRPGPQQQQQERAPYQQQGQQGFGQQQGQSRQQGQGQGQRGGQEYAQGQRDYNNDYQGFRKSDFQEGGRGGRGGRGGGGGGGRGQQGGRGSAAAAAALAALDF